MIHGIRIWIQHFNCIRIQSGSMVWMTKKIQLTILLYLFLIKNCNFLMSKLQEKPSALKRNHPAHPAKNEIKLTFLMIHNTTLQLPYYCQFLFLQWMNAKFWNRQKTHEELSEILIKYRYGISYQQDDLATWPTSFPPNFLDSAF